MRTTQTVRASFDALADILYAKKFMHLFQKTLEIYAENGDLDKNKSVIEKEIIILYIFIFARGMNKARPTF